MIRLCCGICLFLVLGSIAIQAGAAGLHGGPTTRPMHPAIGHIVPAQLGTGATPFSMGIAYAKYLWPQANGVATVYYVIDANSDPNATSKIDTAISIFNADFPNVIQWVAWTSSDGPNYVDIDLSANDLSGVCEANEGYEAVPAQPMDGSTNCALGTILHEMGHVIGLWHEQSRPDRNDFVSVNYGNVIKGSWGNFEQLTDDIQELTPYDYASVMQYPPYSFSRNGGPVIESVLAGIPLGSSEGVPGSSSADYSASDKEAIERLYGAAPTLVTVTSNPVGLQVIVDGQIVTTPQQYNWAFNSTHTLSVPSGVQNVTGDIDNSSTSTTFYYTYGRWNDSTVQTHTIVVAPGNGSPAFPATSPQVATYQANFIQLVPYTSGVYPESSGLIGISPQPQRYAGASGEFFVARQQATLTATPSMGWNFYEFNNSPYWLPGGLGSNPKVFYVPDTGNPVDTTAEFSNTPVFTVDVSPDAFSSNLYAYVDGSFWYTPKNFSSYYDDTWTFGSSHTLNVDSPEYPYSVNSRYAFSSWSDAGAQSHTISSLPGSSTSYIATLTPQFAPATNFGYPPCGGAATISPSSPTSDGFYPTGTQLTFNETPSATWTFAGWTYDLTGTANPANLTPTDESLVFANFNITNTPLTLTGISPAISNSGVSGFTLTLTGTGFTADSNVIVNGIYRTVTYVSPTELQVQVDASDVTTPGGYQVAVENFPSGWNGCAVWGYQTFMVQGPMLTPQTITFTPVTGTRVATTTINLTASASSGLPVVFSSSTPTVCTISGSTASLLSAGQCGIAAIQEGNNVYAPATPVALNFTVHQAGQTITFPAIGNQIVGTRVTLSASASSGLPVTFDSATPSVCTVSGIRATMVAKGNCTIQAMQAGNTSYLAVTDNNDFVVTPEPQTINFPAIGGTQVALTDVDLAATASSALPVSFASSTPTVCTVSGTTASLLASGQCAIAASQAGNSEYAAAPPMSQHFTVHQTSQTITFGAISSQLAGTQLTLSATASSGLTISYTSTTTSICTVSGDTATMVTNGNCTIEAKQAGDPTYLAAPTISHTFAVTLPAQTITFPPITGTQVALGTVGLSATASSGLTVQFSSSTPSICTVSGLTASLLTSGQCAIVASQPGNSTYAAAQAVSQHFTVHQASQTIDFPAISSQVVGAQVPLSATATSGLAVTFASTTTSVCTVSGTTATMVAKGNCTIEAKQAGNLTYLSVTALRTFAVTQ
jgi:hypothetical protein